MARTLSVAYSGFESPCARWYQQDLLNRVVGREWPSFSRFCLVFCQRHDINFDCTVTGNGIPAPERSGPQYGSKRKVSA